MGSDAAREREGDSDAGILAEIRERKAREGGADGPCIVVEKESDEIADGNRIVGLHEERVRGAEAVVCEAAEAPHAGAWIETTNRFDCRNVDVVAPHTGPWIETVPCA